MNIRRMPIKHMLVGAAILVIAGLFVACGGSGDDDDGGDDGVRQLQPGEIRTDKGLAVAALANSLGANFGGIGGESEDEAASDTDGASVDRAVNPGSIAGPAGDIAYPYPQASGGGVGLTVQGYGSATAAADSAVIEIYFYRDGYSFGGGDDKPVPEPGVEDSGSGSSGSTDGSPPETVSSDEAGEVDPITEADLQPVIDALNAADADSVEFVDDNYYYDRYYASATIRATFNGTDSVDGAHDSAVEAANGLDGVFFSGSNMYFSVSDCSALERAAMDAALEDANENGDVLAEVISAARGEIIGASNYTYSPSGDGSCSSSYYGYPYPLAADGSEAAPGATDVQVFSSLTVTYAIN